MPANGLMRRYAINFLCRFVPGSDAMIQISCHNDIGNILENVCLEAKRFLCSSLFGYFALRAPCSFQESILHYTDNIIEEVTRFALLIYFNSFSIGKFEIVGDERHQVI